MEPVAGLRDSARREGGKMPAIANLQSELIAKEIQMPNKRSGSKRSTGSKHSSSSKINAKSAKRGNGRSSSSERGRNSKSDQMNEE